MNGHSLSSVNNGAHQKAVVNYFVHERHAGDTLPVPKANGRVGQWRMKERMKTVSVSLVMCLNIGVDPPDVIKTAPCARLECWIDPLSLPSQKALDTIGKALQAQYERWQPRAKYKLSLDPTVDEVKKVCTSLRRNAKDERVVFHYNGHGVPRPTNNGEIWVFNRNYTQYIPLSIYELQTWMGSPSIFVFDCSHAGLVVHWFNHFADQRERKRKAAMKERRASVDASMPAGDIGDAPSSSSSSSSSKKASTHSVKEESILLAACGVDEFLPNNQQWPVDIFTACLTTPIKVALRFGAKSPLADVEPEMLDLIPGKLNDRKTPLGELNWIFTAITDTIAWNVLSRPLFQRLFRQDLLVASLFRNFLLAERVMRAGNCTPISVPALPAGTYNHPMWQAWDLAADLCLAQLPRMLSDPDYEYERSPFFSEQLTSFEVWLEHGPDPLSPPAQLPIVLQVLLSQAHRLRALVLLGRFLDVGPWAVNLALSVGIFPYVLKLLQSPVLELRKVLVFIWTKLLALDKSCQVDLVKDNGHNYFINVLSSPTVPPEQRTQAAFVLTCVMDKFQPGRQAALASNLLAVALSQINDPNAHLRRWCVLCLGKLWDSYDEAKTMAVSLSAHERVCGLLTDAVPEVRAAAVWALSTFLGGTGALDGNRARATIDLNIGLTLPVVTQDGSPLVRRELVSALARLVDLYHDEFVEAAHFVRRERLARREEAIALSSPSARRNIVSPATRRRSQAVVSASPPPRPSGSLDTALSDDNDDDRLPLRSAKSMRTLPSVQESLGSIRRSVSLPVGEPSGETGIYICLWKMVLALAQDPYPELANLAALLYESVMGEPHTANSSSSIAARHHPGDLVSASDEPKTVPSSPSGVGGSLRFSINFLRRASNMEESGPAELTDSARERKADDARLTLRSTYYEWSCDHFRGPLHADLAQPDTTSHAYLSAEWRRRHNDQSMDKCARREHRGPLRKFDEQIAMLKVDNGAVRRLLFHPFEDELVVADDRDGVHVWRWKESKRVCSFANSGKFHARVTSLTFANERDDALLLTGAHDGVVRLWSSFSSAPRLVTAWRALNESTTRTRRGAGTVLSWQQHHGLLFASGDVNYVRVWDAAAELTSQDIPTKAAAAVTCLASDLRGGRLVVAGCGDGSVRLFDWRVPPLYSHVQTMAEHQGWLVTVAALRQDDKIVSGAVSGEVKIWDTRVGKALQSFSSATNATNDATTAMCVHEWDPVLACGSQNQRIKVMDFRGQEVSTIRYHDGFLGQRIGPVSALAFHPRTAVLACGATDSLISIYRGHSPSSSRKRQ